MALTTKQISQIQVLFAQANMDDFKKIAEILSNNKIENPEQIDNALMEKIMTTISKNDLQLILDKMQENSKFKELLQSINNKFINQH